MNRSPHSSQPYPLYDYLAHKADLHKDRVIDLTSLCATINQMSYDPDCPDYMEHYREIAALIIHHDLINNKGITLSPTPYEGRTLGTGKGSLGAGRGIVHSLANFPPKLQHILLHYVEDPAGALHDCQTERK